MDMEIIVKFVGFLDRIIEKNFCETIGLAIDQQYTQN